MTTNDLTDAWVEHRTDEGAMDSPEPNSSSLPAFERPPQAIETGTPPVIARSFIERFVDSFFQPKNIKWMLVLGAAIVFGSSLMLVKKEWSTWPAAIKFGAILGYTAMIYLFGEIADRGLALKSTGNVLRGLTLLLLPVMMLGLRWVASQESWLGIPGLFQASLLLVPAATLQFLAGRNILKHFLRGDQTTFVVCYGLLSLAGMLPSMTTPFAAICMVFALWGVMTIGVIKVNRHVFWLTEEHRLPGVFGFFPILLVGSQFVLLACSKALSVCPPEWLGACLVMFSATILMTARTVASVYRQRTGDLVRPLPWSIVLPLFVGILLSLSGVALSCWGVSFTGAHTTYAIVPTAILAACLMSVVAYDTRHRAFAWLMLVLLVIAYQSAPILVKESLLALQKSAASAVHEERLPIAFYGITYMPLLAILSFAYMVTNRWRRSEFSQPIQQFITLVAGILFASSFMHAKAIFPVAVLNLVAFLGYAMVFRDRRYAYISVIAGLVATAAFVPFVNLMYGFQYGPIEMYVGLCIFGAVLYTTKAMDRSIALIPLPSTPSARWMLNKRSEAIPFAYYLGLGMLLTLATIWVGVVLMTLGAPLHAGAMLVSAILLGFVSLMTYRSHNYVAGLLFAVMTLAFSVSLLVGNEVTFKAMFEQSATVCTLVSVLGLLVVRWSKRDGNPWDNVRTAFGWDCTKGQLATTLNSEQTHSERTLRWLRCHLIAISDVATVWLVWISMIYYAPETIRAATDFAGNHPLSWQSTLMVGWLVTCIVLLKSRVAATALSLFLPLYTAAAINTAMPGLLNCESFPVAMVSSAAILCWLCHLSSHSHLREAHLISRIWLSGIACLCFVYVSIPSRIAGAIAIVGIYLSKGTSRIPGENVFLAILLNVHVLLFVAGLGGASGWLFAWDHATVLVPVSATLFPALCLSALISERAISKLDQRTGHVWAGFMGMLALGCFGLTLSAGVLPMSLQLLVVLGIVIGALSAGLIAVHAKKAAFAWLCLGCIATLFIWLWDQHLVLLGQGASQLLLVVLVAASLWLTDKLATHATLQVFAAPLRWIGLIGPGVVAGLAVVRWIGWSTGLVTLEASHVTIALNNLALLAAACLYFIQGMKTGLRRYYFFAAAILDTALLLFCHDYSLRDPQFYCVPIGLSILGLVELLKRELPKASHDPLRYIGSLVILVSPVLGMRDASWVHLFSLMVLCVLVILIAMGLRIRALIYTGSAFLLADLCGMVIWSTIDNAIMLWVGGIGLGVSLIALAAYCENHREILMAKIRMLSATLATWN